MGSTGVTVTVRNRQAWPEESKRADLAGNSRRGGVIESAALNGKHDVILDDVSTIQEISRPL